MNLSKKILSIIPVLILFWGCTNFTDGLEKNSTQNNSDNITVNCSIGVNGAVPDVIIDALKNNPGSERTACPSISASKIGYLIEKTCGNEKEIYDSRAGSNNTSIKGYYLDGSNEKEFTSSDNKLLSGFSIGLEIGKSYSIVVKVYDKTNDSILLESNVVNTGIVSEATVISEPLILKPVAASAGATGTINLPIECAANIVTKLTVLCNGQEKDYTESLNSLTFTGKDFFSNTNAIPAGSYDFIFRFYHTPSQSGASSQLLCEVQQTIPVYPNLCTNTWVKSDSDDYFTEDASGTVKLNITGELAKSKKRTIYYIDSSRSETAGTSNYTQQIGNAEQPFVSLTELKNKVEFDSDKKYNIYIKVPNDGIYKETLNEWVELDFPCTIETYKDFPGDKKGRAEFTAAQNIQPPNINKTVGVIYVTSDCDIYNVTVQAENNAISSNVDSLLKVNADQNTPTVNLYNCEFKNANRTGLYLEGVSSYRVNCNLYGCKISNIEVDGLVVIGGIYCSNADVVMDSYYDGKETEITECISKKNIGGIRLHNSCFIMKSGCIKSCKGGIYIPDTPDVPGAGGIYIDSGSVCTIYGGTIGGTGEDGNVNVNTGISGGSDICAYESGATLYFYGGVCLSSPKDGTIYADNADIHIKGSAYIGDDSVIFLKNKNSDTIILDGPLTHSGCVAKVKAGEEFSEYENVLENKDGKDFVKDYFSKFTIVNSGNTSWGLNNEGKIVQTVGGLSESPNSGTYYITCPQDYAKLLEFGNIPSGVTYKLACDIDISGVQNGKQFSISGTFDGDNNSITSVSAAIVSTVKSGGKLQNLTLSGSSNTAGFANTNEGTIDSCINYVNVNNSTKDAYIAGIVQFNKGTIKNCVNNTTINGTKNVNCGGIAARCEGNSCVIDRCINYGELKGSSYETKSVSGGIVAVVQNSSSSSGTVVSNCANYGKVTNHYAGGIVGFIENAECSIKNCYYYNSSKIQGLDSTCCGEIAGYKASQKSGSGQIEPKLFIYNSYSNKDGNEKNTYTTNLCALRSSNDRNTENYNNKGASDAGVQKLVSDSEFQSVLADLNSWVNKQTAGLYYKWKLDTEKGYPVFDK